MCNAQRGNATALSVVHTQLVSLINGATTVIDVALAKVACRAVPAFLLQGGQQTVDNEVLFPSNGTLMKMNVSHFSIWLAPGRKAGT